jgi:hypothetical protein
MPDDTCVDDTDCTESGSGYCMYRPEVAHWAREQLADVGAWVDDRGRIAGLAG